MENEASGKSKLSITWNTNFKSYPLQILRILLILFHYKKRKTLKILKLNFSYFYKWQIQDSDDWAIIYSRVGRCILNMMFLQNFLKRFMLTNIKTSSCTHKKIIHMCKLTNYKSKRMSSLLACMLNILPPKFDYNIATHNLNENKISVK